MAYVMSDGLMYSTMIKHCVTIVLFRPVTR
jgi:hypothetical protein